MEHGREALHSDTVIENLDWDEREGIALGIVETVASVTGKETTELEPLTLTIDTDALNNLFVSFEDSDRATGYVQFTYEGCLVELSADGKLGVTELEESKSGRNENRCYNDGGTDRGDSK
jgi:hypothetical protein